MAFFSRGLAFGSSVYSINSIDCATSPSRPWGFTDELKEATVEKVLGNGDIKVYAFTSSGSYVGLFGTTDNGGQTSFDLSDGKYRFRADYLGYQIWSDAITVPDTLDVAFPIPHQPVQATILAQYYGLTLLTGVRTYLFTVGGSYLNRQADTNAAGQAVFDLPELSYKLRVDYLGHQFWSDPFVWADPAVVIDHGLATVHVTDGEADVQGAKVHLFSGTGAYQGWYEFSKRSWFRAGFSGQQVWSAPVEVPPEGEIAVDLELSPP